MIVVDASAMINALTDDEAAGKTARLRLLEEELSAPEIIDLEIISVLRKKVRTRQLPAARADQAMSYLIDFPLERVPHRGLLPRIWELRGNLNAYDASYVALAEIQSTILVTTDARLAWAPGPRCEIEVLAEGSEK